MAADDALVRFVVEQAAVRGARVSLGGAARAILATHDYPPALARVIAELLAASTLLASTLKFDGTLAVQLSGDGPLALLVVECDQALALRATAQWDQDAVARLPDDATLADLAGGPSRARLVITLDPKGAGTMYQGIVALESATVATMIEHYLATSEQLASRLALVVGNDVVGGLLLQRMPGSGADDDQTWSRLTDRLSRAPSDAIAAAALGNDGLAALLPEEDLRVFRPSHPTFRCSCSPARVEGALRIAGRDEIEAALAERGEVEVICEFCRKRYVYAPAQARALFPPVAPGTATRH